MENILCPKCNRKVGSWDGKATVMLKFRCKHCGKAVVFDPETKNTKIRPEDGRTTSSGAFFY